MTEAGNQWILGKVKLFPVLEIIWYNFLQFDFAIFYSFVKTQVYIDIL